MENNGQNKIDELLKKIDKNVIDTNLLYVILNSSAAIMLAILFITAL